MALGPRVQKGWMEMTIVEARSNDKCEQGSQLQPCPVAAPLSTRQRIWCVKTAPRPACPTMLDPPSAEVRPSSGTRLADGQITTRTTKLFVSFFHVSGIKASQESAIAGCVFIRPANRLLERHKEGDFSCLPSLARSLGRRGVLVQSGMLRSVLRMDPTCRSLACGWFNQGMQRNGM